MEQKTIDRLSEKLGPKSIGEAIHAIYGEIGYVQKEGQVNFGNTKYKYAGEAAFIAALRPVMVKYGVTISVNCTELAYNAPGHVIVRCTYIFAHKDSGTFMQVESLGEGKDSGDKAIPKALTGAYKYALRQTFMLETGDDPDKVSSEELVENEKKVSAAQTKRDILKANIALDGVEDLEGLKEAWAEIYPLYKRLAESENEVTKDADNQNATNLLKRKDDLKKQFEVINADA